MGRLFTVIFLFNSIAMFVYMCAGLWVVLPALVGFLTGMNLVVIFAEGKPAWGEEEDDEPRALVSVSDADGLAEMAGPPPPKLLPLLCGLLVLLLELPAFWYALGMGISLGHFVRETYSVGQILMLDFRTPSISPQFMERCTAYLRVIVPVLAVSAWAEAYAVSETTKTADAAEDDEG